MQDLIGQLAAYIAHFTYIGTFVALFLCGVAIPLPEEPLLLAAGYVAYESGGQVSVWGLIGCAMAGILLGDLAIFNIGRRHGDWVFKSWLFRRLLPEERLARARRLYAEHGSKVVFFGRFIAGIRFVAFFTAGNLGVRTATFVLFDFLAAMITVPISIYAAYYFGEDIHRAIEFARKSHRVVIGGVAGLVAVYLLVRYIRARRAARRAPAPVPEPASRPGDAAI